jgi:hypothetical protein
VVADLSFSQRRSAAKQGCQMVNLNTENTILGTFWRSLEVKRRYILRPFGIHTLYLCILNILQPFSVLCCHLVDFVVIWCIRNTLGSFGILGTLCGHLVHFVAIWHIFGHLVYFLDIIYVYICIFLHVLYVCCTEKNLATLPPNASESGKETSNMKTKASPSFFLVTDF